MSTKVANGRWTGHDRAQPLSGPAVPVLVGIAFLSLLLSVSGAYDTDEMGLAHRSAFWIVFSSLVVLQVCALETLFARLLGGGRIAAAGSAAGATVVLMAAELHALKFTPLLPKEPDPFPEFVLFVAPPVLAICAAVLLLRHRLRPARRPVSGAPDPVGAGAELPSGGTRPPGAAPAGGSPGWPADPVLRVRARDHYLEIVTPEGTQFLRGRMTDAIARLRGFDGVRVHRSWWVATGEIESVRSSGRDYVLLLKDGSQVPVGRSRIAALRARKLL